MATIKGINISGNYVFSFFFFSLISLIADGPHHYHSVCGN